MRSALLVIGLAAFLLAACGEKPPRPASEAEPQASSSEPQPATSDPQHALDSRTMRQSESTRIYH